MHIKLLRPFHYDHLILLIWYDKILQRRELNQSLWITSSSLWSDQGFLHHLEFLNPRYALPSQHYITLTPLSSYNVPVCALVLCVLYSRACKTGNLGDAERVWNRQATRPCHFTWQCKEYVKMDDMEVPSVGCVSNTSAGCTRGSAVTVQRHRFTY